MSLSIYVSIYNGRSRQETFLRSSYEAVSELILEFKCKGIERAERLGQPHTEKGQIEGTGTPKSLSVCKLKACLETLLKVSSLTRLINVRLDAR